MAYTRAEILNSIRYNEEIIRSYQDSIKRLSEQISELSLLKSKIQSYQSDFRNKEANRKNRAMSNFDKGFNYNFIKSYLKGMQNLVGGSEYRRAYNSMTEGIHKVDTQIAQIHSNINDYNNRIRKLNNYNSQWRQLLKYAQN